jgi:predicted nuclease with TOPRIM domain
MFTIIRKSKLKELQKQVEQVECREKALDERESYLDYEQRALNKRWEILSEAEESLDFWCATLKRAIDNGVGVDSVLVASNALVGYTEVKASMCDSKEEEG